MNKRTDLNSASAVAVGIIHVAFILLALVCVIPIWLMISVSLTDEAVLTSLGADGGYKFWPVDFSLSAYQYLFSDAGVILNAYKVTILVTIVGSLVNVISMMLFAYPISREDFPYKKIFSIYLLITMILSGGLVASYMVNTQILRIKNTVFALVLPSLGGGFSIFVMRTYFKNNMPTELIDAAKIDGAGEFRTFLQIIVPIVQPIIASMLLFDVFGFWNNWTNSLYYVTTPSLYTLQYVMQKALLSIDFVQSTLRGNSSAIEEVMKALPNHSLRMAMVVVGIGPIVAVYPFLQKYFIRGLTEGAV